MWSYNQAVQPPAPFLEVIIHHPKDSAQITTTVQAKLDTGADISALPVALVTQLGLPMTSKMIVEGYDGIPTSVSTYSALMEIAQC